MERITKKIIDFLKKQKEKKLFHQIDRNRKEVNINGYGTHKYTIKQGINKGKVL